MRHKVTSASGSFREYKAGRENGEKMDDVHAEFRERRGCLAKTMLRFSEGPSARAISARAFHTGGRMPSALRFSKLRVERHVASG